MFTTSFSYHVRNDLWQLFKFEGFETKIKYLPTSLEMEEKHWTQSTEGWEGGNKLF